MLSKERTCILTKSPKAIFNGSTNDRRNYQPYYHHAA